MRGTIRGIELAALLAVVFMIGAGAFNLYQSQRLKQVEREVRNTQTELRDTLALKALWDTKGLREKVEKLRGLVRSDQMETFRLKKHMLELRARKLSGRDLNRLMSKLGALPLQIQELEISRSNDLYTLECRCKW